MRKLAIQGITAWYVDREIDFYSVLLIITELMLFLEYCV